MDKLNTLRKIKKSEMLPHALGGIIGFILSLLLGGIITAEADDLVAPVVDMKEEVEDDSNSKLSEE